MTKLPSGSAAEDPRELQSLCAGLVSLFIKLSLFVRSFLGSAHLRLCLTPRQLAARFRILFLAGISNPWAWAACDVTLLTTFALAPMLTDSSHHPRNKGCCGEQVRSFIDIRGGVKAESQSSVFFWFVFGESIKCELSSIQRRGS